MAIPGLLYVPDYIDEATELQLLAAIDAEPWLTALQRRVQHYGYPYDYKARTIDLSMYLGPLPSWAAPLCDRLKADGHMDNPEQLIVNEYEPGQGISAHVDVPTCFGPVVCAISLGSSCVIRMSSTDGTQQEPVMLERRSLLVLRDEARFHWRHEIATNK